MHQGRFVQNSGVASKELFLIESPAVQNKLVSLKFPRINLNFFAEAAFFIQQFFVKTPLQTHNLLCLKAVMSVCVHVLMSWFISLWKGGAFPVNSGSGVPGLCLVL